MAARNDKINTKARYISRWLISINLATYFLAFLGIVSSNYTADIILDHLVLVFCIAFTALIISFITALFYKTIDEKDKMNLSFFYFALFGINLFIGAFIYFLISPIEGYLFG